MVTGARTFAVGRALRLAIAGFIVGACARAAPPRAMPAPCAGDRRIYVMADTNSGVRPARMTKFKIPPRMNYHGTVQVRVLVTPRGVVLRDSTRITAKTEGRPDQAVLDAVDQAEFEPATRGGCAVSFWYEMALGSRD